MYGAPLIAALLTADALGAAAEVLAEPRVPVRALAVLAVVAVAGIWIERRGTSDLPWMRRRGVNLSATRGGDPAVWLVAHLDSKSQPVPLVARTVGVVVAAAAWIIGVAASVSAAMSSPGAGGAAWLAATAFVVAALATLPLVGTWVHDRSAGALDNASGVATVLEAAEQLPDAVDVGVLITSAEELGLAGARAWAGSHGRAVAINVDGVDDVGRIVCVVHRRAAGTMRSAVELAGIGAGCEVAVRRAVPGVLFDSVALAQGGWRAVTVMRGTSRSLARVHTVRDSAAAWRGAGVAETARFVAALARTMVAQTGGADGRGQQRT